MVLCICLGSRVMGYVSFGRQRCLQWLSEVITKVVVRGDEMKVVLNDKSSGELFAECPVKNETPLDASVEPVIDSSRYFVLRCHDSLRFPSGSVAAIALPIDLLL